MGLTWGIVSPVAPWLTSLWADAGLANASTRATAIPRVASPVRGRVGITACCIVPGPDVSLRHPAPRLARPDAPRHGPGDLPRHACDAGQPPGPRRRGRQPLVPGSAKESRGALRPRQAALPAVRDRA